MQITITTSYEEAFRKCYPAHSVRLKPTKLHDGDWGWWIVINGERGDRPLTDRELVEATKSFLR